jgi:hypothetical protein
VLISLGRVPIFRLEVSMLIGFMASRTGRWLRILAGAGMVVGGLASGSARGGAVALVGLAPLVASALDLVLLGPFFGHSIRGADIRRTLREPEEARLFKTRYERLPLRERMLLH